VHSLDLRFTPMPSHASW